MSLGILLKLSLCKFYYFNHPQVVCPIHYVQTIVLGNQINCFPLLISNSKCTGNQLWNSQAEFKLKKKPIVITIAEHACNHVCSEDSFKAVIVKTVHASLTSKFLVQPSNTECGGLETTCTDLCQMFQHSDRMFEQILQISFKISFGVVADTCKSCPKFGKGFKIGTNEGYNIKIKLGLGHFENFLLLFSRQYGCLRQRHFTEEEILEKIFT